MKVQMQKWGNSLAVRVPKSIALDARLSAGDSLDMDVDEHGVVRLKRVGKVPTLAQLVAQMMPENRTPETAWGADVGREVVEW